MDKVSENLCCLLGQVVSTTPYHSKGVHDFCVLSPWDVKVHPHFCNSSGARAWTSLGITTPMAKRERWPR
jgi:hypothetical protein